MASEFPKFLELPPELRLMIWQCLIDEIPKQRVVTVSTPAKPISNATDRLHTLLHTCKESRNLLLPRYTSAFGVPRPGCDFQGSMTFEHFMDFVSNKKFIHMEGTQLILRISPKAGWEYLASMSDIPFNTILKYSPLIKAGKWYPPIKLPFQSRFKVYWPRYLDRNPTWDPLAIFGRPYPLLGPALWFDANNDVLLFRYDRNTLGWTGGPSPGNDMRKRFPDIKAKKIAFEIGGRCHDVGTRLLSLSSTSTHFWNAKQDRWRHPIFPLAENVSFLIPEWFEVVTITLDEKDLLKPGQWCFSLDTDSSTFKEEMGDRWDSVTWRVTIAKERGRSFNELLWAWSPHSFLWRLGKEWLYDKKRANGRWNYRYKYVWEANLWQPEFLNAADAETILGPSFVQ